MHNDSLTFLIPTYYACRGELEVMFRDGDKIDEESLALQCQIIAQRRHPAPWVSKEKGQP